MRCCNVLFYGSFIIGRLYEMRIHWKFRKKRDVLWKTPLTYLRRFSSYHYFFAFSPFQNSFSCFIDICEKTSKTYKIFIFIHCRYICEYVGKLNSFFRTTLMYRYAYLCERKKNISRAKMYDVCSHIHFILFFLHNQHS